MAANRFYVHVHILLYRNRSNKRRDLNFKGISKLKLCTILQNFKHKHYVDWNGNKLVLRSLAYRRFSLSRVQNNFRDKVRAVEIPRGLGN